MRSNSLRYLVRLTWHKVYPWTGLNGLDRKLVAFLEKSPGFFIEAGANDGVRQSNTYFLEKRLGWTGLLVEPVPRLARRCTKNRRRSIVEQCVLVGMEHDGEIFDVIDLDLMTIVPQHMREEVNVKRQIQHAERVQRIQHSTTKVTGRALSNVLNNHSIVSVDLLSLDVEGSELSVLDGLDLRQHAPNLILIETKDLDAVLERLDFRYSLLKKLSHHDYLLKLQ